MQFGLFENLELDVEKFFELESLASFLHRCLVLREMNVDEGRGEVHQVHLLAESKGECVGYTFPEIGHETLYDSAHRLAVERCGLHLFGRVVVRLEPFAGKQLLLARESFQLGVNDVVGVVEARGFAEENIGDFLLEFEVLDTLKPYQLDGVIIAVGKLRGHALHLARTYGMILRYAADNLHVSVLVGNVTDIVESASVDILVRKDVQQVESCTDVQLLPENFGSAGTDSLAIVDIFIP